MLMLLNLPYNNCPTFLVIFNRLNLVPKVKQPLDVMRFTYLKLFGLLCDYDRIPNRPFLTQIKYKKAFTETAQSTQD